MRNILIIMKKEFARFFKDKRMIFTLLFPGLLIYGIYSIMGDMLHSVIDEVGENYKPTAYVVNMPSEVQANCNQLFELTVDDGKKKLDEIKTEIEAENIDILVIFPENFDDVLLGNRVDNCEVKIYYNSTSMKSQAGFAKFSMVMEFYKAPLFTVNSAQGEKFDLANENDVSTQIYSMLVPMLLFSLLGSGCMAVAPEAIAGEKERGTMATMLITPVKRWELAVGKICALSVFALLSGISSFLGVIFALPKLMGGAEFGAVSYGFGVYLSIFLIIISLVLFIISLFSVVSCLAKSVKEAASFVGPLLILLLFSGMSSIFFIIMGAEIPVVLFAIPLIGSGIAISNVLSSSVSALGIGLAVGCNFIFAIGLTVLLGYMFKSEKIMFGK